MKLRELVLIMLVLALAACGADRGAPDSAGPASASDDWPRGRLPDGVVPRAYRLELTIIPDQPRFSGRVEIDLEFTRPVSGFWMHGLNLDVGRAQIIADHREPIAAHYAEVGPDGAARLSLTDELPAGPATLALDYAADFEQGLNGLYKVSVGEDDYAFTQFESTYARKAFPGFDEPAFKTPFTISVTTRENYRALSNTHVVERESLPDGLQRVTYATTEPLPTYLVAFAVGPLDVVEHAPVPANEYRSMPLPLRGVAARGQGERLAYALENTAPLVANLEAYFGRAYPFDKLDIVAVPDFSSGAMENAGLITYREPILLFDDPAPFGQKRFYGLIHAHELAHQWFGNLVTMPWWDDIWLNEAFASWLQARIAQAWRPGFRYEQSVQSRALRAMANDSLVSARQIREPVNDRDDILSAFDTITYQKGAAVLQMFERYLGEATFQAGIQAHMGRFAFGSATVFDLLDSLETAAGDDRPVRAPFESFLFQPGVPHLDVAASCSAQAVELQISQQRYLPVGSAGRRDLTWQVPVCMTLGIDGQRAEHCVLLTSARQDFSIPVDACPDWLVPNAGGAGYYRWILADGMDALADNFLTGLDGGERLAYVDSLVAGIGAGTLAPEVFFDTLPQLALAPERLSVTAAINAYQRMLDFLVDAGDKPAARQLGMAAFAPRLAALDAVDGALTASDRALLTTSLTRLMALRLRDAPTRARLRDQANRYLGYPAGTVPDPAALDQDLLKPALIVAVQDNEPDFVDFLLDDIRASDNARRRQAAVQAIAHAVDPAVIRTVRAFALGGELRGNEFQTWAAFLLNPDSREQNWPWLQSTLREFMEVASARVRRQAPIDFSRGLCSRDHAQRLRRLFEDVAGDYDVSPRSLDQAVETVELCAAFREAQAPAVRSYFARD
ncbi:MAG: M1 family aminopeptidase [Gammaproteobacteria bacterium]